MGLVAIPAANDGVRIRLDKSPVYQYDYSLLAGGWSKSENAGFTSDTVQLILIGTDIMAAPTPSGSLRHVHPVRFPYCTTDTPSGDLYEIKTLSIKYYRQGASDVIIVKLLSYPKAGGAATTLQTWDATQLSTTAALTTYTDSAVDEVLDFSDKTYVLQIEMTHNSSVGVGPILVGLSRGLVE